MPLLFLEFLGTTELLVIMVVALVLFGPRKLPQIGHSIGKSLSEFKRASEDFKRTWEAEVSIEESTRQARVENAILPDGQTSHELSAHEPTTPVYARGSGAIDVHGENGAATTTTDPLHVPAGDHSIAAQHEASTASATDHQTPVVVAATTQTAAPRKQDWL
jgi:TatA/E family protein of Tat protein translocase